MKKTIYAVKHIFSLYSVTYRHIIECTFAGRALRHEDVNKAFTIICGTIHGNSCSINQHGVRSYFNKLLVNMLRKVNMPTAWLIATKSLVKRRRRRVKNYMFPFFC